MLLNANLPIHYKVRQLQHQVKTDLPRGYDPIFSNKFIPFMAGVPEPSARRKCTDLIQIQLSTKNLQS